MPDTYYVRTYYVYMNVTLSLDDEVIQEARRRAEAMGTKREPTWARVPGATGGEDRSECRCRGV